MKNSKEIQDFENSINKSQLLVKQIMPYNKNNNKKLGIFNWQSNLFIYLVYPLFFFNYHTCLELIVIESTTFIIFKKIKMIKISSVKFLFID